MSKQPFEQLAGALQSPVDAPRIGAVAVLLTLVRFQQVRPHDLEEDHHRPGDERPRVRLLVEDPLGSVKVMKEQGHAPEWADEPPVPLPKAKPPKKATKKLTKKKAG